MRDGAAINTAYSTYRIHKLSVQLRALTASSVKLTYFIFAMLKRRAVIWGRGKAVTFPSAKRLKGVNMSERACEAFEAKGQRASEQRLHGLEKPGGRCWEGNTCRLVVQLRTPPTRARVNNLHFWPKFKDRALKRCFLNIYGSSKLKAQPSSYSVLSVYMRHSILTLLNVSPEQSDSFVCFQSSSLLLFFSESVTVSP